MDDDELVAEVEYVLLGGPAMRDRVFLTEEHQVVPGIFLKPGIIGTVIAVEVEVSHNGEATQCFAGVEFDVGERYAIPTRLLRIIPKNHER